MAAKVKFDRGAWWVVTHFEGRRKKKRVGATKAHKREAEQIARKINGALALGQFQPDAKAEKPLPCEAELWRWHTNYSPTMKPSYRVSAGDVIRLHLAPFFGAFDVREIREEHLLDYVRSKLAEERPSKKKGGRPRPPIKPITIRVHLAILRRVLGLLEREEKITKNPARGIGELLRRVGRSIASETEEVEHWTRGEVEKLIALARKHEPRFAPFLVLLFATGCRRGEGLGLQWGDVDFDSRVLTVRRAITKEGLTTPKSGKARRVPMTPGLAEELFDLLAVRRRECLNRGWPEVPTWVFCSEVGGAPDPSNTERTWLRLRRRAHKGGVRPLKLHCTRHTWASLALEAGRSVRWVADVLGHADPALTLRVYTHAVRVEEADLSFADFARAPAGEEGLADGSKRPYTAPRLGEGSDSATDEDQDAATSASEFADFAEENGGGPGQNRTADTRIFSAVLYQLSYRATGREI